MLSVRSLSVCPVCLSVTFVHSGQTVGRIKTKLETQVGLGPGHIVLDGDGTQLPSPKGAQPPIFVPYLLRPNGCMDKDVTWYGARPRPRRLCVRWGPNPYPKKGGAPPNFRPTYIVAKRLHGSRWHLVRRLASAYATLCSMWTQLPPEKRAYPPSPNFWPMSIVAKWLDG